MDEFKNMDKLKDELFEAIDKICKDYESKHEPEFKVPGWGNYNTIDNKNNIFYITKIIGHKVYGIEFPNEEEKWQCNKEELLSVTPAEIESHLRKICDKKYIGKKVKCLRLNNKEQIISNPNFQYYEDIDEMWYQNMNNIFMCVYKQSKFAEIIPDKKKLPKTREELKELLRQVQDDSLLPFPTIDIDDFLDQYEIQ